MIGHDPGKLGSWYEEGYVVLQLLRLLDEHVESVTWEARHDDGLGIDLWLVEGGVRLAIQCKTHSTGAWTVKALASAGRTGKSVLAYARHQLQRHPSAHYRFVSDAPCPELMRLVNEARTTDDPGCWWRNADQKARSTLLGAWQLSEHQPDNLNQAYSLVLRIELIVICQEVVDRHCREMATSLAGAKWRSLVMTLQALARRSLTRTLHIDDVRKAVEDEGITLEPRAQEPRVDTRLTELAQSFEDRVVATRGLERIEREEAGRVVEAVLETPSGRSVLVIGPAGCGKSEVLVAALEQLQTLRVPVLALLPDQDASEIGLGDDPVATLVRFAAGRPAALLLDQLDQVLVAGDQAARRLRWCGELIRGARRHGIRVVAACRAVDAEQDTQLQHLLAGASGDAPLPIRVPDLAEPEVVRILARNGIAVDDLEPPLRRLAARPLCLRMLLSIHRHGGSIANLRSLVTVVDRWWQTLSATLPGCDQQRATRALDAVLQRMEREGALSIAADGFDDGAATEALVRAGVLLCEQRRGVRHVRPTHQVLVDVRLAQSWRNVTNADDLLQRIGRSSQQGLQHARRLRLAVPLLLERMDGTELVDGLLRAETLRPLVKRGVLLALAAVDQPQTDLVSLVVQWLGDESLRPQVLRTVVRGQVPWMEVLENAGWLEQAWDRASEPLRDDLLDLLAAVATRWGDGVARCLHCWSQGDPEVLQRAGSVFLHAPGDDSDELFAMRLEHVARQEQHERWIRWDRLLRERPDRAVALLAALLPRLSPDDLYSRLRRWPLNLPAHDDLSEAASALGWEAWQHLGDWWRGLPVPKPHDVSTAKRGIRDCPLVFVVELLAANLARASEPEPERLDQLQLPGPLRWLDGWLLLRIGARLPDGAAAAADRLAEWFASDRRWAYLQVDFPGSYWELDLARSFVARVGGLASDGMLRRLERWIETFHEPWSVRQEQRRWADQSETGAAVPSDVGLTAFRLLSALPPNRLGVSARRSLASLERKFAGRRFDGPVCVGGVITSSVPDEVADRWSTAEWTRRLLQANARRGPAAERWRQLGPGKVGSYSVASLSDQLRRLARSRPARYLDHALAFDEAIPAEAREAVLDGIATTRRHVGVGDKEGWEPLDDASVAEILDRPGYLDEPMCERQVGWIVADRPAYPWPGKVLERLETLAARVQPSPRLPSSEHDLQVERFNDASCLALWALAAVSRHQPELAAQVLGIAQSLVDDADAGRRASAAMAAAECWTSDADAATEVIIAAASDPVVAAEQDVSAVLRWLAGSSSVKSAVRTVARDCLLSLAGDRRTHIASRGGEAAMILRSWSVIDDTRLGECLDRSPAASRAAAAILPVVLDNTGMTEWLREVVVRLANDSDEETGNTVLRAIGFLRADDLASDLTLLRDLLATKACRRHLEPLLEACDRLNQLAVVAKQVLDLADAAARPDAMTDGGGRLDQAWDRHYTVSQIVGLVARLVEEAESGGDHELRSRALDAWDRLLQSDLSSWATVAVDNRIREG